VRLEGLGKLKKIHLIGTRTLNLPACSIVPQPTTIPRVPFSETLGMMNVTTALDRTALNSDSCYCSYVYMRKVARERGVVQGSSAFKNVKVNTERKLKSCWSIGIFQMRSFRFYMPHNR
jgi:hypothetical protein